MATFTVSGFELMSNSDNLVSDSKVAQLQFVAPLGEATLDFRYVAENNSSAEVSLSDYNIILNGMHLNDGDLPDRIELFNAAWPVQGDGAASSQVFNLAFSEDGQWRDYLFSVDRAPLPDFTNTDAANGILANTTFSTLRPTEPDNMFSLQLDDMPGVAVSGVIQQMFDLEVAAQGNSDRFEFSPNPNAEAPDMTEFDIVARAFDDDHLSPPQPEQVGNDDVDADPIEIFEQTFDDMAG